MDTSNRHGLSRRLKLLFFVAILIFIGLIFSVDILVLSIGILLGIFSIVHIIIKLSGTINTTSVINVKSNPKYKPFVSIHVACKNESAEIVNKTIEAMTKLDYTNYEVIVINSNNTDEKNYLKIKQYVESCGNNFKFIHLDSVSGFKAGALNYINTNYVDENVEIIAIVDCDYIVETNFLSKTVGYFSDKKVGIVQAPQSYYNIMPYNIGLAHEYQSFFTIVMNQAQRLNLVTFTGTMGLIRADLIRNGLKWNEWCITEDVEAGIHINSKGYKGVYIDESLGKGLMPFDYVSLIKQRQRWTYGNMQVIIKDLLSVTKNKALSTKQKIAFISLMVTWFHFELLFAVVFLCLNILIIIGISSQIIMFTANFMLFLLAMSLICNLLYFIIGLRKNATFNERLKAFFVHYGLIYVMSSSWLTCLFGHKLGFIVTDKQKRNDKIPLKQFSHEFIIIIILLVGLLMAIINNGITWFTLITILPFVIVELTGIFYLKQSFVGSDKIKNKRKDIKCA